jgi:sialic acid synthase SpsE
VTPFSVDDVKLMRELDVDAVKIASPDAVNRPLLESVTALDKPIIISTGACDIDELDFAADLLKQHSPGGCLLQCVSSYPTPVKDASLGGISVMADRYGLPVGYSDHTTEVITGALAVMAGACVLEKHFTYNCDAEGPDHAASLDPVTFTHYVDLARRATIMQGPLEKRVRAVEQDVRETSRQSVCATRDLSDGHVLSDDDLTVKRPGGGIPAAELPDTIGKTLNKDISANSLICHDDID